MNRLSCCCKINNVIWVIFIVKWYKCRKKIVQGNNPHKDCLRWLDHRRRNAPITIFLIQLGRSMVIWLSSKCAKNVWLWNLLRELKCLINTQMISFAILCKEKSMCTRSIDTKRKITMIVPSSLRLSPPKESLLPVIKVIRSLVCNNTHSMLHNFWFSRQVRDAKYWFFLLNLAWAASKRYSIWTSCKPELKYWKDSIFSRSSRYKNWRK